MNNVKERRFAHKLQERLPGVHVDFQRVSFIVLRKDEKTVYMAAKHFQGRGLAQNLPYVNKGSLSVFHYGEGKVKASVSCDAAVKRHGSWTEAGVGSIIAAAFGKSTGNCEHAWWKIYFFYCRVRPSSLTLYRKAKREKKQL